MAGRHGPSIWFWRALLVLLAVSVFVVANLPTGMASSVFANDKANHALAFAALTPLVVFSFPGLRLMAIFCGLLIFNAGIEITQGTLGLGRQPEVLDWVAGALATAAVLVLIQIARLLRAALAKKAQ